MGINMNNRQAHEEAAGMGLDDMFFRMNRIDPDAEYIPNRPKIERLTARSPKNGMAYLVKVKNHEQDLEGAFNTLKCVTEAFERLAKYEDRNTPKSIEDWDEEDGDCLWWCFPIVEAPYCGSPLDCDFPDYVTHYTKFNYPLIDENLRKQMEEAYISGDAELALKLSQELDVHIVDAQRRILDGK
jgi:hypothetical protein